MKEIKLKITGWWGDNDDDEARFNDDYLIKLLRQKYKVIYSHTPDFLIFGPFDNKHLQYDCVRIFFTGENIRTDWNIADYGIDFDYMDFGDRHLRFPLWVLDKNRDLVLNKHKINSKDLERKNKFCSFMVTSSIPPFTDIREEFFDKLCQYKRVDSGGRHKNNIGGVVGDRFGDYMASKIAWLKNYKFNIAFENSSFPGYLTEKLFNAFAGKCVPIYWGDTSLNNNNIFNGGGVETYNGKIPPHLLDCPINPKAFINAHNFESLDALIEEIKRIDNDNKAYQAMLREPVFLDNRNPYLEYEAKLIAFFDNIFSQNPKEAFRRGRGQHLYWYERYLQNSNKVNVLYRKLRLHKMNRFVSKCKSYIKL